LVRAAFRADARRADAGRRRAAVLAWRESARFDAGRRLSRFNARLTARARRGDARRAPRRPARLAAAALCFVFRLAEAGGAGRWTPARRAFERPIAIACFVDRAPCFPSRT
jgi:hypothetical protein